MNENSDTEMLLLSPKQLSLLLFKQDKLKDFAIERNLPRIDSTDTAIKFQRENYRKTINLILMSLDNMEEYLDDNNLYLYFPNFRIMAYHMATGQVNFKTPKQKIIDSDQYLYDTTPRWEVLEAVVIVFVLNSLQNMQHGVYYDAGFRNWKKRLDTVDDAQYFASQIKGTQKASRMIEQRNFLMSELEDFDKYAWWLLEHGHDSLKSATGRPTDEAHGYFQSIEKSVSKLITSNLMEENQMKRLAIDKKYKTADQLVDSIVDQFAFEMTHWREIEGPEPPEIKWNCTDFDWSEDPYPDPAADIWRPEISVEEIVDKRMERAQDNYLFYHQFLRRKGLEKLATSDAKYVIEDGLYRWLTATHYMKLIIAGMIIPGILDAISNDIAGNSNQARVVGADILVPFHNYLDSLMGYGKEFK